jgi:CRISPR/Cas system-associated exonuclease Cas4 (RecB family)
MNEQLLQSFNFWRMLDEEMMRSRFSGERRASLWPSESSVVATDPETGRKYIIGGCMRKSWYRLMQFPESNPRSVKSQYTMELGRRIEQMITDLAKMAGIFNNNSVKFWERSSSVSGEIDVVVQLPVDRTKYVFLEIKTSWGGNIKNGYETGKAKSLFDHFEGRGRNRRLVRGRPKMEHVLQLAIYLYVHKDDPNLVGGKLVYMLRDNLNRTEFNITLRQEEDKHRVVINGEVDRSFYVEDIFARFRQLIQYVNESVNLMKNNYVPKDELVPPPRDFSLEYTAEEVENLKRNGLITDASYRLYRQGKKKLGDWQCSWCSYKNLCYNIHSMHNEVSLSEEDSEEETEEVAEEV